MGFVQTLTRTGLHPRAPRGRLEKETAEYLGCMGALALSSGTAALHLGLKLLGVLPGDTVFCSSLTFSASVNPAIYEGAGPVFIDSDRETWNMSPSALKHAFEAAEKNGRLPRAVIADLTGRARTTAPFLNYQITTSPCWKTPPNPRLHLRQKCATPGNWERSPSTEQNNHHRQGMLVSTTSNAQARFWSGSPRPCAPLPAQRNRVQPQNEQHFGGNRQGSARGD